MERVVSISTRSPLVIFTLSTCCMCHAIYMLFVELGADPSVHELDCDSRRTDMERALEKLLGRRVVAPSMFIGGKLVGAADTVFTLHLGGRLVPLLKEAGALYSMKSKAVDFSLVDQLINYARSYEVSS